MEAEISEVCFAGVFLLDGIRTLALQAGLNIIFTRRLSTERPPMEP